LVYHASVRVPFAILLIVAGAQFTSSGRAQDNASFEKPTAKPDNSKSEPKYDETFSGPIVEFSPTKIVVSRSILGKPAEKHSFSINSDTRIEGKLRVKAKVTVGYVTTDDGDIAKLVVVRTSASQKQTDKK
jgi:hypothetical protein